MRMRRNDLVREPVIEPAGESRAFDAGPVPGTGSGRRGPSRVFVRIGQHVSFPFFVTGPVLGARRPRKSCGRPRRLDRDASTCRRESCGG